MQRYYTLIASLPYLPPVTRAKVLPLSRQVLDSRLTLLEPADRALTARAEQFLEWQHQSALIMDREILDQYRMLVHDLGHPALVDIIEQRMTIRSLMAAVRLRQRGIPPPESPWALPVLQAELERQWQRPDFGMAHRYPWLPGACRLYTSGQAMALQTLLTEVVWHYLSAWEHKHDFTFDQVLVYLFKWDILQRWLSYDESAARRQFRNLADAASGAIIQLFPQAQHES